MQDQWILKSNDDKAKGIHFNVYSLIRGGKRHVCGYYVGILRKLSISPSVIRSRKVSYRNTRQFIDLFQELTLYSDLTQCFRRVKRIVKLNAISLGEAESRSN